MARPKKQPQEKRTETIEFRCSPAEKKTLQFRANAKGMTVSDYMRVTVMQTKPRIRQATPFRATMIKGIADMGKIGSNLNQLMKVINTQNKSGKPVDLDPKSVHDCLHEIQLLSTYMLKYLSDGH